LQIQNGLKNEKINVSENCLDRHLEDRSEKTALI